MQSLCHISRVPATARQKAQGRGGREAKPAPGSGGGGGKGCAVILPRSQAVPTATDVIPPLVRFPLGQLPGKSLAKNSHCLRSPVGLPRPVHRWWAGSQGLCVGERWGRPLADAQREGHAASTGGPAGAGSWKAEGGTGAGGPGWKTPRLLCAALGSDGSGQDGGGAEPGWKWGVKRR